MDTLAELEGICHALEHMEGIMHNAVYGLLIPQAYFPTHSILGPGGAAGSALEVKSLAPEGGDAEEVSKEDKGKESEKVDNEVGGEEGKENEDGDEKDESDKGDKEKEGMEVNRQEWSQTFQD
jgi:hypothetical protein